MSDKIILSYCMGCGLIKFPGREWETCVIPLGIENPILLNNYQISHGYCEPCGEKAIAEARAEIAKAKRIEWVIPDIWGPFKKEKLLVDRWEYGIGGAK